MYLVIRGLVRRSDRGDLISKQVRTTTDLRTNFNETKRDWCRKDRAGLGQSVIMCGI